jgi:hypothetical protein
MVSNMRRHRDAPPTEEEQLAAGLHAFFNLAKRWKLTVREQCALLAVSASTRMRWKTKPPAVNDALKRRLRLVILTYQRLLELTWGTDAETARVLRQPGSADNPDAPKQSLL